MNDDDLKELAYSAHEEAMSFGLSHETFLRYFQTVRRRSATPSEITVEMMTEAAQRVGFDPVPGRLIRLAGVLTALLAGEIPDDENWSPAELRAATETPDGVTASHHPVIGDQTPMPSDKTPGG